jgi:RNA polymerase sigma factor (sigma-70 family)
MPVLYATDAVLLATYVKEHCDTPDGRDSLGELVRRHLDFVFGVARRAVRDPAMAEDVTQAVFLILARKAHTIRHAEHLGSWLFQTTRYTAANAIKMAARRSRHEKLAARQEGAGMQIVAEQSELVYQLDDALAELPQAEREVILLRFFRGQEYGEIADHLALTEPAARKRFSRGVERLREILGRRNAVSVGAVVAAITLAGAERASAALEHQIVPAVQAGAGSEPAMTLASMAQETRSMVLMTALAFCFAAVVAGVAVNYLHVPGGPAVHEPATASAK